MALYPIFLLFLSLLAACLIMHCASRWIDCCYQHNPDILSYPDIIAKRARFRLPALTISFGLCIFSCQNQTSLAAAIQLILPAFFLLLVTCTDFEQYVIFDRMLLPFALLALPFLLTNPPTILPHIEAALAGGLAFLLLAVLLRGAIGGGDIKLIAVLGLWLTQEQLLQTVMAGFILGGLAAFLLMITKKKGRHDFFAYGPYFALSALYLLFTSILS